MRSACQLRWRSQPPCALMKTKINYRSVHVLRKGCVTKRGRSLFRRRGWERQIELRPAGKRGFVSLRLLISLFVSVSILFLALLVTATSFSEFRLRRLDGSRQRDGSFPTIKLEPVASGLTQPTTVTN